MKTIKTICTGLIGMFSVMSMQAGEVPRATGGRGTQLIVDGQPFVMLAENCTTPRPRVSNI